MCDFCCNFAADFEMRMDLTACNLAKKMLKKSNVERLKTKDMKQPRGCFFTLKC